MHKYYCTYFLLLFLIAISVPLPAASEKELLHTVIEECLPYAGLALGLGVVFKSIIGFDGASYDYSYNKGLSDLKQEELLTIPGRTLRMKQGERNRIMKKINHQISRLNDAMSSVVEGESADGFVECSCLYNALPVFQNPANYNQYLNVVHNGKSLFLPRSHRVAKMYEKKFALEYDVMMIDLERAADEEFGLDEKEQKEREAEEQEYRRKDAALEAEVRAERNRFKREMEEQSNNMIFWKVMGLGGVLLAGSSFFVDWHKE